MGPMDIFRSAPTNYVEKASGAVRLEDFFAKKKAAKAKQPITPEKKEEIKKEYSLTEQLPLTDPEGETIQEPKITEAQLQEVPSATTPQPPTQRDLSSVLPPANLSQEQVSNVGSALDSIDMEQIKAKAEQLAPKKGFADYLPYLAPLLVEGLFGGGEAGGVSAEIAGKQLMSDTANDIKRKQTLEDKLLELEKAKLSKKTYNQPTKGLQSKSMINRNTGEVVTSVFDPNTGKHYDTDMNILSNDWHPYAGISPNEYNRRQGVQTEELKKRGDYFGRGIKKDEETGLWVKIENGKKIPISEPLGKLNPEQERKLDTLAKSVVSTPNFRKTQEALAAAQNVDGLLQQALSNNPSASQAATVQLARMAGEVGALSESDIKAYRGSPALKAQAKRIANLETSGNPLTKEDILWLKQIADVFSNSAKKRMADIVSAADKDFVENLNGVPGAMQLRLAVHIPQYKSSDVSASIYPKTLYKGGKQVTVSNAKEEKEAKADKWLPRPSGGR